MKPQKNKPTATKNMMASNEQFAQYNRIGEPTKAERGTSARRTLETTAALAAGLTLAASVGATIAENVAPHSTDKAPTVHADIDTRHTDTLLGDKQQETLDSFSLAPIGSRPDSIEAGAFSAPVDLSHVEKGDTTHKQAELLGAIAEGTMEGLDSFGTPAETRMLLNESLKENNIDMSIDSIVENANRVVINREQHKELKHIATALGYKNSNALIAEYAAGALNDSAFKSQLDAMLETSNTETVDINLQSKEMGNLQATIYESEDELTIVVDKYEHTEHKGSKETIVLMPILIPIPRRRTTKEQLDHDQKKNAKQRAKAAAREQATFDESLTQAQRDEALRRKAVNKYAIDGILAHLENTSEASSKTVWPNERISTQVPENGRGYTYGPSHFEEPIASEKELAQTTDNIVGEATESDEVQAAEPESEVLSQTEKSEKQTDERNWRRTVFRTIGTGVLLASLFNISNNKDASTHHNTVPAPLPVPSASATHTPSAASTPDSVATETQTPQPGDGIDRFSRQYSTAETGVELASTRVVVAKYKDGTLVEGNSFGTKEDLIVIDRVTPVAEKPEAPKSSLEDIGSRYDWNIPDGGTGEGLMKTLGVDPSEWYELSPELLKKFPDSFYGDPARISKEGELPKDVRDYLVTQLDLK